MAPFNGINMPILSSHVVKISSVRKQSSFIYTISKLQHTLCYGEGIFMWGGSSQQEIENYNKPSQIDCPF